MVALRRPGSPAPPLRRSPARSHHRVSQKGKLAEAIRYALSRWDGLARFLDDGRFELDSNTVERAIRAPRPQPQKQPLRRLRRRPRTLGGPRLACGDLQAERRRAASLHRRRAHPSRERPPEQPPRSAASLGLRGLRTPLTVPLVEHSLRRQVVGLDLFMRTCARIRVEAGRRVLRARPRSDARFRGRVAQDRTSGCRSPAHKLAGRPPPTPVGGVQMHAIGVQFRDQRRMAVLKVSIATVSVTIALALATSTLAADQVAPKEATDWLHFVDNREYGRSWSASGALFHSQVSEEAWVRAVTPIRQPLGTVLSRTLKDERKTDTLPGLPGGKYDIIQFSTSFANKREATETVILAKDPDGWRVDGYFIR